MDTLKGKRELAVIIDNAPGFSGLEPAVEEWLTNLGPECGKFMFVGTMDIQDIKACVRSIQGVHRLYSEKWKTAISFKNAITDKEPLPPDMNAREKRFLSLLAEIADKEDYNEEGESRKSPMRKHEGCINCGLCFYRLCAGHEKIGEGFRNNPSQYIALIANKVPPPVYDGSYDFILTDLLEELGHDVKGKPITLKTLRGFLDLPRNYRGGSVNDILRYLPDRMIPFEERWSLQFLAKWLKDVRSSKPGGTPNLSQGEEREQIARLTESTKQFYDKAKSFDHIPRVGYDHSELVINIGIEVIISYDEILRDTIRKTSHRTARSFEESWGDEFGLTSRYASFISSVLHTMHPKLSSSGYAYTRKDVRSRLAKVVGIKVGRSLSNSIARGLSALDEEFADLSPGPEERSVLNKAAKGIAVAVALATVILREMRGFYLKDDQVTTLTMLLFSMEIELFRAPWTEKNLVDEPSFRDQMNREARPDLIREDEHMRDIATHVLANWTSRPGLLFEKGENWADAGETLRNIAPSQAIELYLSFFEAQLIFVDVPLVLRFVTGCLETIWLQKDSSHSLVGMLKDLAQMVIVDKLVPYDIGWNRLEALGLQHGTRFPKEHPEINETSLLRDLCDAKEMKEFKEIARSILGKGQWKLL